MLGTEVYVCVCVCVHFVHVHVGRLLKGGSMVGRKEGVCDCGKDGDPGHGVLERGNRVSITGKGGGERVVW